MHLKNGEITFRLKATKLGEMANSSWMKRLRNDGLAELNLLQITIPGTHDSATSNISTAQNYASNAPDILKTAQKIFKGDELKDFVCRWAIAQEKDVGKQLEDGIRYIDLRVCCVTQGNGTNPDDPGELFTCHSVISDKLDDVLHAVKAFTEANSEEIIILDFNHFYKMTPAAHTSLVEKLNELFSGKMIPKDVPLQTKLAQLWDSNYSLLIFYEENSVVDKYPYLWPQANIYSAWMNTPELKSLKTKLTFHLATRDALLRADFKGKSKFNYPNYANQIHVAQGILTPDTSMIASDLFSAGKYTSLIQLGKEVTPVVTQWLTELWKDYQLNVVIVDQYHYSDFIETIIQMNLDKLNKMRSGSESL